MELIVTIIGRSKSFEVHDTGLLGVCFRTAPDAGGEHLCGCLCGLLTAPGLDVARLHQVGVYQSMMLHRAPFKLQNPVSPSLRPANGSAGATGQNADQRVKSEIRKKQAIDHDKIWTALEGALAEPEGTRMKWIADTSSEAIEVFKRYPRLTAMEADIESATKLTGLVDAAWAHISNNSDRTNLFKWRKKAGLPSRRAR